MSTSNEQTGQFTLPLDRLCIHQVTLMQCGFEQSIACFARNGVSQTAVWREKLDEVGSREGARILANNGVTAVSLCAGGFFNGQTLQQQQRTLDDNARWLDQAAEIGAQSMVTITGGLNPHDTDIRAARDRALEGLTKLIPVARSMGVKLALEPLHPMVCGYRSVISTLTEALDMLDVLNSDDVMGVALDSYALWWDPGLEAQIERAAGRIFNFHASDWLTETRDVRLDRGMPGDGHIDNQLIRRWLEKNAFKGSVEVEIFSEQNWWKRDADEVVKTIVARVPDHL